jgi:sugar/nucleoside kinase (ribokinase family)
MSMVPELVIVSHVLVETIRFSDGRTLGPVLGGPGSYASVAAARLGARVGLVAKIGQGVPRDLLRPVLESGVDTAGLIVEPEGHTNLLSYDERGWKTLRFLTKPSPLSLQDIPDRYRGAEFIYCGSGMWEPPLAVVRALSCGGTKLAADIGGYGGAHHETKHHSGGYDGFLRELLPYLHIAKASQEDCATLFAQSHLAAEQHARLMAAWGAQVGVVTLGDRGAVVATADELHSIPPFTHKAVDATGAGDVFSAAFLVRYQRKGDPQDAGEFASAAAALVCERTGGVTLERIPSLSEVEARLSQSIRFTSGSEHPIGVHESALLSPGRRW